MTIKEFSDVAGQFAHDADVLGAAGRLWDKGVAVSDAKLALAGCTEPQGSTARAVCKGDLEDATLELEQQVQQELINLGEKAVEWIPKIVGLIVAAV